MVRNLAETVRAPIDIVLFGRNLTASLPAEQLLPFFGGLCEAIAALRSGQRRKALVPFAESPWELALVRHPGDAVAISLYRVLAPADVLADGEELPLSGLQHAVRTAIEDLDRQASKLPHHPELERWRRRLRDGLRLLDGPRRPLAARPAHAAAPVLIPVETSCNSGLWLVTELDVRTGDALLAYEGEEALDRHALLVPGTFAVAQGHGHGVRMHGRPLFLLEALLDACVALVAADGAHGDDVIELCLAPGGHGTLRVEDSVAALTLGAARGEERTLRVDRVDLVSLVAQHVEDVVAACLAINPLLETNAHLAELRSEACAVRRRSLRDLATTQRVFAERLEEEAAGTQRRNPPAGRSFPVPFRDIRLLRSERTWRLKLPTGLAREVLPVDDDVAVVHGRDGTALIDLHEGRVAAAVSVRPGEGACISGGKVLYGGLGELRLDSPGAAGLSWTAPTHADEAVQSAIVHDELVVVAYRSGLVEGRAVENGDLRWTRRIGVGVAPLLHVAGDSVLIGGRAGELLCVDAENGGERWRRLLALPLREWRVCGQTARLALWHAERRSLSLIAVALEDGSVRWSADAPADEVCLGGTDSLIALVDDGRRRTLHRVDGRACARHVSLEVPRTFVPGAVACTGEGDHVWVAADGMLRAYSALEGGLVERWCQPLDPQDGGAGCELAIAGDVLAVVRMRVALHAADTGRRVVRLEHPFDDLVSFALGPRASFLALERDDSDETTLSLWQTVGLLAPVR